MSKLASIQRIHSFRPHGNADRLSCAKVLEWPVVIKKDEYKDGDLVVFIVIDSIVDKDNPYFAFMEKQKFRVWNARFRGEPSSGLVVPVSLLPGYVGPTADAKGIMMNVKDESGEKHFVLEVGDDVSEYLCISKYEKPIPAEIMGMAKGNFPTNIISITDEDNLLSYPAVVKEFAGLTCYITAKQDGSSMTVIHNNGETHICSRRLSLKEGDNAFWRLEKKYNILQKLKDAKTNVAIQMELCGPKLNGNNLGLTDIEGYVFNVRNLDTGIYGGLPDIQNFCAQFGLLTVPLLQTIFWDDTWNIERLRAIADGLKYPNGKPGEGIVIRPCLSRYSEILGKMLSVKLINQNYKE